MAVAEPSKSTALYVDRFFSMESASGPFGAQEAVIARHCTAVLHSILGNQNDVVLDENPAVASVQSTKIALPKLSGALRVYVQCNRPLEQATYLLRCEIGDDCLGACDALLRYSRPRNPGVPSWIVQRDLVNRARHKEDLDRVDDEKHAEATAVQELLQDMPWELQGCPHLYEYNWLVEGKSHVGAGDLVFTDGQGIFIVVEVKHLNQNLAGKNNRVNKKKKLRQVQEQAKKYHEKFCNDDHEDAIVLAAAYTNLEGLRWVLTEGQRPGAPQAIAAAAAKTVQLVRKQSPKPEPNMSEQVMIYESTPYPHNISDVALLAVTAVTAVAGLAIGGLLLHRRRR